MDACVECDLPFDEDKIAPELRCVPIAKEGTSSEPLELCQKDAEGFNKTDLEPVDLSVDSNSDESYSLLAPPALSSSRDTEEQNNSQKEKEKGKRNVTEEVGVAGGKQVSVSTMPFAGGQQVPVINSPTGVLISSIGKTSNGNADALSCRPYGTCSLNALSSAGLQTHQVHAFQWKDQEIGKIIDYLENDLLPADNTHARRVLLAEDVYFLDDNGILYHQDKHIRKGHKDNHAQLVLPPPLQYEVLVHAHDDLTAGHLGTIKTYEKLRDRFYWRVCTGALNIGYAHALILLRGKGLGTIFVPHFFRYQ